MDMIFFIVLWLIFVIVQNFFEKNKPTSNPPPPRQDNRSDFEIPTLANDPNFPNEEPTILVRDTTQAAEVREINLAEIYRQKKISAQAEKNFTPKVQVEEVAQKKFSLDLTPSATMNAIILGEILSKPKFRR